MSRVWSWRFAGLPSAGSARRDVPVHARRSAPSRASRVALLIRAVREQDGFTLLELVTSLAVIAIVLAAAAPVMLGSSDDAASAETTRVVGLLRSARRAAVTTQSTVSVVLDRRSGRIWVRSEDALGRITVSEQPRTTLDVAGRGPRVTVRFRPDGSAVADRLTLAEDGRTTVVSVDRWTGRIDVER